MRQLLPLLLVATTTACGTASRYGTPRTLAPGETTTVATLDVTPGVEFNGTDGIAPLPRLGARHGLTDTLEIGGSITGLPPLVGEAGLDLKWNFHRSPGLDLALAPAVGALLVANFDDEDDWDEDDDATEVDAALFHATLPLLAGINVARWATVVPHAGLGLFTSREATGPYASVGVGLQFRPSATFAIQPGVEILRRLDGDEATLASVSLGLFFGPQPRFD
ncbi:hypothetical protein [Vulgatibacter sp.]|uniref:hypothetical protein n=1 Tax=Vulgatibacter sp. TaxID=1971226 RepID=UPI003566DAE6